MQPRWTSYVAAMVEPGALTAALNWYRAMSPESMGDVGMITVPTLYVWSTEPTSPSAEWRPRPPRSW